MSNISNFEAVFPIIHPPVDGVTDGGVEYYGMSLRDYFAAKALNSIMDGSWTDFQFAPQSQLSPIENCARFAYQVADAMLVVRDAK